MVPLRSASCIAFDGPCARQSVSGSPPDAESWRAGGRCADRDAHRLDFCAAIVSPPSNEHAIPASVELQSGLTPALDSVKIGTASAARHYEFLDRDRGPADNQAIRSGFGDLDERLVAQSSGNDLKYARAAAGESESIVPCAVAPGNRPCGAQVLSLTLLW